MRAAWSVAISSFLHLGKEGKEYCGEDQWNAGHITIYVLNTYPLLALPCVFSIPKIKIDPSMKFTIQIENKTELSQSHHRFCFEAVGGLENVSKSFL